MKINSITIVVLLLLTATLNAQQSEWKLFNTSNSGIPDNQIQTIYIDNKDVKWIGTASGLAKFDNVNWEIFNTTNSPIPSNYITSIASDGENGIWIGTDKGLAHFNNGNWQIYTTNDSSILSNEIQQIRFTGSTLWFCTDKGLMMYHNKKWETFDSNNSGLFYDFVYSVTSDNNGTVWCGSFDHFNFNGTLTSYNSEGWKYYKLKDHGLFSSFPVALVCDSNNEIWLGTKGTNGGALVKIAGDTWTVFDKNNSGFPGGGINCIALDGDDKWIGGSGLILFKDGSWYLFNQKNSGLPDDYVSDISLDKFGNKWIATIGGGLAVYKKDGVITSAENHESLGNEFKLLNNYPNPFNPSTTIKFVIPFVETRHGASLRVTLKVYDMLGREVATLVNEEKQPGTYEVTFNASNAELDRRGGYGRSMASGVYFYTLRAGDFIQTKKFVLMK